MTKIREGYKDTEIGVIPEDWEVDNLINLCTKIFVGIATSTTEYFADIGIPLIRNQNIKEGKLDSSDMKYITEEFAKSNKSKTLQKGDILTVRTGYPGISCVVPEEFEGTQTFTTLISRPKSNRIDSYYLSYFINSGTGKKILESLKAGGAQQNLNVKSFETLNVVIPPLPEQQRIAEIISTTDVHIEKLDKTIEDYQLLKKGMMKKLLTEGIGHTEFKETEIGKIPKEWEVVSLLEVAEIISGGTPKTSVSEYWECGDVMWATPTDITSNGKYITKTEKKITKVGLKNSAANLLPSGTILMTSRATIGERCINKYPMSTNQGFKSFICKQNCHNEFLYYYIEILKPEIIKNSSGSTFLEISKSKIELLKIALPNLEEQKYISDVLSSMDDIIKAFENDKSEYITLKKSLMEKLLTGKIRVDVRSYEY